MAKQKTHGEWTRRSMLASAALSAMTPTPMQAAQQRPQIRIHDIQIFRLRVNSRGNWVLVRVRTDQGLTGLGDASHAGADDPQVEWIERCAALLKGRSVYDTGYLLGHMAKHAPTRKDSRPVACAFSAVEQAMLDIQAQAAGVPLCSLFGGALRNDIRNYANINRSTDHRTPEGFVQNALAAKQAGFDAIKLAPFDGMPRKGSATEIEAHTRLGVDCIRAVREAIGPNADLLVDAHSHFDRTRGFNLLRQLEPMQLFWLEEVCPELGDLRAINDATTRMTAGGESLYGLTDALHYVEARPVDVLMPDVKYCGGMQYLKQMGALAQAAGMQFSPHGPASPVGNLSAAHVSATQANFLILEYSFGDAPWRAELLDPPEPLAGGVLTLSGRPGLGHSLNEKVAASRAV